MSTRRYRSAVACHKCRRRKVRCSVTVTGVPCTSCAQDGSQCIISQGAGRMPFQNRPVAPYPPLPQDLEVVGSSDRPITPSASSVDVLPSRLSPNARHRESSQRLEMSDDASSSRDQNLVEERTGAEIATAAFGQSTKAGNMPFYTGESPGVSVVLDLYSDAQHPVPRHFLIPSKPVSLSTQDREYMQQKGVFLLPGSETCNALIRAYFLHVHPIMPVVDVTAVLQLHSGAQTNECNLLLLWSIFFVAVNFIPTEIWRREGYSSRKKMKEAVYSRAKCMYDNSGETDKIVLLQSSLLLGFHHPERDAFSQPWYWTGVAISLCQIIGLHRPPDLSRFDLSLDDERRRFWRRLWWCCFFRDRWLSLTLGRPLRINLEDCDMAMPVAADMLSDVARLPESTSAAYIPSELPQLAEYWVLLIQLSKLLGEVLALSYRPSSSPTLQQVEALEAEILLFRIPPIYGTHQTKVTAFSLYHLQLHYQAFLITFYRPFITKAPENLPLAHQEVWQNQIRNKIDVAALQTNVILDSMTRENLLGFAAPMTPSLLVPAMHTHLLNCKSADILSRRLGLNKLDFCMAILGELQNAHTSASIYRGIFLEAIRQLFPDYNSQAPLPESDAFESSSSMPPDAQSGGSPPGMTVSDDVINALMDDVSIFNFWESLNQM
ncbi:hypothetical protein FQN53_003523 [Emmonsiellopsis sp. PD_33]|nr:hypothetical protein FQN53_003523 [Emmonsiellopsis sp. PD_33]